MSGDQHPTPYITWDFLTDPKQSPLHLSGNLALTLPYTHTGRPTIGQELKMREKISFENRRAQTLAGVLHRPESGSTRACAIFAHCFTCTKNSKAAVRISEALAAQGIEVLRFDFTGLGQSEGDFSSTHFSSNVDDLADAAAYMG
ncbi:MAG: hypothetical protein WBS20_01585, partial [Lysobacterales bacterium]